tara:strand:- start:51 stop:281 length:231 start_codon:yes stop_codon:yes gene_type:complete
VLLSKLLKTSVFSEVFVVVFVVFVLFVLFVLPVLFVLFVNDQFLVGNVLKDDVEFENSGGGGGITGGGRIGDALRG